MAVWASAVGLVLVAAAVEIAALGPVGPAQPRLGLDLLGRSVAHGGELGDRLVVLAAALVDLAQVHVGVVPLLPVGPGLGGVLGQVDQPLQVARAIDLGVGVVRLGQRLHADLGGLGREPPLGIAAGQVLGQDVGFVILLVHVIAERQVVAGLVGLVDVAPEVRLADGRLERAIARSQSREAMASSAWATASS